MALPEAYNTQMTEEEIAAAFKNAAKVPNLESAVAANTANVAAAQSEAAINRTTLGFRRKNLLNVTKTSSTSNGITFTVNDDKTITVNGTATATVVIYVGEINIIANKNYILSGCPNGGSNSTYKLDTFYSNASHDTDYGTGVGFTTDTDITIKIRLVIYSGQSIDNLTFYPMLRYAEITDDTYEPYRDSVDERLTAVENSVEIAKPTLTVNATYIANSRLYCHKVGKLVFIQGTITTSAEVPAWTTGLISGLPTISQAYYFRIIRTGTTASTPTIYLNSGGTTVNVENNALAAEATYYLNFCYIEY